MELLMELINISKSYQGKPVFRDVNLKISAGDSIAFTGHNGSGKSTILKIIGGFITYDGKILCPNKLKLSYVPEHFPKLGVTAKQYMNMTGVVEGMDKKHVREKSEQLFHDFYMESMVDTPIKFLSKGTQQKVAVIQAMLQRPDVLLLDEPLSGQDADSQRVFIDMVNKINGEGTAIVMSCHEDWLMKAISKNVYEIIDKKLCISEKLKQISDEYAVLRFGARKAEQAAGEDSEKSPAELALKVDYVDGQQVVYAEKARCSLIIQKMLEEGFELRGMEYEKI